MAVKTNPSTSRANSIIALGFSREARRFLLNIGLKTKDSLSKVDFDYLACNGASAAILEEVSPFLGSANIPKANPWLLDEPLSHEADRDNSNEPPAEKKPEENATVVDLRTVAQPQYNHLSLERALADAERSSLCPAEAPLTTKIATLLLLDESGNLAVHSTDKELLRACAKEAWGLLEEELALLEQAEGHYSRPVDSLAFSTKTANVLKRLDVETVGDLCAAGESTVVDARNAGPTTVAEIHAALNLIDPLLIEVFRKGSGRRSEAYVPIEEQPLENRLLYSAPALRDVPFDSEMLSVRAQHALAAGKITTVGNVLESGLTGLKNIPNAGTKTAEEIMRAAINQAEGYVVARGMALDDGTDARGELPAANRSLTDSLTSTRELFLDALEMTLISPKRAIALREENPALTSASIRHAVAESLLLSIITVNPWGITSDEAGVCSGISKTQDGHDLVEAALKGLERRGAITVADGLWTLDNERGIDEALSLRIGDETRLEMVSARFAGKTLDSIGSGRGLTRERVRQITERAMKPSLLQGTRAGRYLDLMSRYKLSEDELCNGLGATAAEWRAASLVDRARGKKGAQQAPSTALLEDKSIPERVRFSLEQVIHRGYVNIDGEYVRDKRQNLALHVLRRHASAESISREAFRALYAKTLDEHELSGRKDLALTDRYLDSLAHSSVVIASHPSRLRYYDMDEFDVRGLVDRLDFEAYRGLEISTRIFALKRPDLLGEYEINDEYELHRLLRMYSERAAKRGESVPYIVSRRMPMLKVGDTNRKQQIIRFAQKLSPVSVDDFARICEEEFGFAPETFKVNEIPQHLGAYVDKGTIRMELETFTEAEAERMSELLPGDFYRLTTLEGTYAREFPGAGTSKVNSRSIKELGFKPYSSCILRSTWRSQNEFFDQLIFRDELFDKADIDEEVSGDRSFAMRFDSLVRERRVLPYEGSTWITEKGLATLGIDDASVLDFVHKAESFCESRAIRYCTIKSLQGEGFSHDLLDYEMSDEFYAAALCSGGTRFTALFSGGKRIACLDDAQARLAHFIDGQIEEGCSEQVDELAWRIKEDYGIEISRTKIISAPNYTELYHSVVTDILYKDKQTFIKEVY